MTAISTPVEIRLQNSAVTIVAGDTIEQELTIFNNTSQPDTFELSIAGLPAGWYSFLSNQIVIFPNQSSTVKLRLQVSAKVNPNIHAARIVVTAQGQPHAVAEARIEVNVLAPLKAEARLQPHRAKGYRANYALIVRNRSMCDGFFHLSLPPNNHFCQGTFLPAIVRIAPQKSATTRLKVQMRPNAPDDQAGQLQKFEVLVQPQWQVEQYTVNGEPLLVEGEYLPESRWNLLLRHPLLFGFVFAFLIFAILWSFLIFPFIRDTLVARTDQLITDQLLATPSNSIRLEQKSVSDDLQNMVNPLNKFVNIKVDFQEQEQQRVTLTLETTIFSNRITLGSITGHIIPRNGNLTFESNKLNQQNEFPWFFFPPDRVVQRMSEKINAKLKGQGQQIEKAEIEGNTLFLRKKKL